MPQLNLYLILKSKKNLYLSSLLKSILFFSFFLFNFIYIEAQVTLTSSAVSNTFCIGDTITFTASGSVSYEFLINGATVQGPNSTNTFTTVLTQTSTVTVIGDTSSQTSSLVMELNDLQASVISGSKIICYGEAVTINLVTHGSVGGVALTGTSSGHYQWSSSSDRINWTNVPGETSPDLTIPSLISTTFFRLKTVNTLNGVFCEVPSNWVEIKVAPKLDGGTIDQADYILCLGDIPQELTISGGSSGANVLYQWQQSVDGGVTYSDILSETNSSYQASSVTQTTRFRRKTYSAVGSCTINSNDIKVTFNDISPGSLDLSQGTALCYNEIPPIISNGTTGADAKSSVGTITYQWQKSINNVTWTDLSSGNLTYYTPTQGVTQTTWFRRMAISSVATLTCEDSTNSIQFLVHDEIIPGSTTGDQTICNGDLPASISLSGASSSTGLTYQWQRSFDNIVFSDISNQGLNLTFSNSTSWTPTVTTYFRVLTSNLFGCSVVSTATKISVNEKPWIKQITASSPLQYVCPGDPIVPVTFEYGGSATGIIPSTLIGSGLSLSGPIGNQYTLSGVPTGDIAITLTSDVVSPCTLVSLQYNVILIQQAPTPTLIRKEVDDEAHSVFQMDNLWYNNTFCQSASPTSTLFFVCQDSTLTSSPTYEWKVTPGTAGVMNTATGEILWNSLFSGTATISVRGLGCGGNSNWLDTPIEILPPSTVATQLTTPTILLNPFCGLALTEIPQCEITTTTLNTNFYATTSSGTADYSSIKWSLENISPGGGLTGVSSPGFIDADTGEMDWNNGFWGFLDVVATPVNCDGTKGPSSRLTINISEAIDSSPSLLVDVSTPFPDCPTTGSEVSIITSDIPVVWSLDNPSAGNITSTDSFTGRLAWNANFSGVVRIVASATGSCVTGESNLYVNIPGDANITSSSYGSGNVTICQGTYLNGIEYNIEGFPTFANAANLPAGITSTFSATHHIVDIEYSGVAHKDQIYRLEILGQNYSYTVINTIETADQVVTSLANVVSNFTGARFDATRIASNTLRLTTKVAGFQLSGIISEYQNGLIVANINTISFPKRTLTLTGTVTAAPGVYDYTITTEGGSASCTQQSTVARFTVTAQSSLTLGVGSDDDQEICFGDAISPINYVVNNALSASVSGLLPLGLSQTYSSTSGLTITGTPTNNVTQTTVYVYTVETLFNQSGCSPEATATGTLTIHPKQEITLSSAVGTDNQTICNSGPVSGLVTITYQLGGSTQGYTISPPLPSGIGAVYDPVARIITISGSPTKLVTNTTVYPYSITTSGTNCTATTISGTIEVEPQPTIALVSASGTDAQVGTTGICIGSPIQTIIYELSNNGSVNVFGLPPGLSPNYSGNILTISGIPTSSVTSSTIYTYTVSTTGSNCQPETSITGTIELHSLQEITLSSAVGTDNQTICNSGPVSGLVTITYQLGGSTQGYTISPPLPSGIGAVYDPVARIITISGSPTKLVTNTTVYPYNITTSGTNCSPTTISGNIVVNPRSTIQLVSGVDTDNQVGQNGVCLNTQIKDIVYEINNAPNASVSGLPNGLVTSQIGNKITISGAPSVNISTTTRYTYTITTSGGYCGIASSINGYIEVIPTPFVDETYIKNNDITHITCNGQSDGAITIPSTSPDFDLRIRGGQTATAQRDKVVLNNQPELGDVYSITIDGKTYQHTVIASSFGGVPQTPTQIAQELTNQINAATGALLSPVTASFENPSGINLIAKNPEFVFSLSTTITTSYMGVSTPTVVSSNVVSQVLINYKYLWTGPNNFSSSNLSISNLEAGVYNLLVTINNCSNSTSQASFTIEEPNPIGIDVSLCNGAFQATISGGTAPYITNLYDSLNNRVQGPDATTSVQNYTGLTPGANYRLVVTDAVCSIPQEMVVKIPFEINFDPLIPNVVNDYCNDSTAAGYIELGGTASGESFSGGSGQFTYEWTGGPSGNFKAMTRDIYNLEAGNYTVTVTDVVLGCSDSQIFTVGSVNPLVIDVANSTVLNSVGKIDLKCFGDQTASIEVSVSGGLGNYSYAWTRDGNSIVGSNSPKLQNLGKGIYVVTVSDAAPSGTGIEPCKLTRTFEVVEPDALTFVINSGTATKTFCPDTTNSANFDLQILGGTSPFDVTITSSNGTVRNQRITNNNNQTITGLDPSKEGNTYTINVVDANGCVSGTASSTIVFDSIEAISVDVKVQQIDCKNGVLGSITLDLVSGNIPVPKDVQIQWTSADTKLFHTWETNNGKLENISSGGKYNVIVSQDNCILFQANNIEITDVDGLQLAVSVLSETSGSCDDLGRIELGITGGVTPYKIYWELYTSTVSSSMVSPTGGTTPTLVSEMIESWERISRLENNAIASDLDPGVYRAIVSDNSNTANTSVCGGTWVSRNFNVGNERFEVINFNSNIDITSCSSSSTTGSIRFELLNTIKSPGTSAQSLKISLDGTDITSTITKIGSTYSYDGIVSGNHTLLIEPNSGSTTPTTTCSALQAFTIEELSPLVYEGETEYELDECEEFIELTIDPNAVTGGVPYVINGINTYDFKWQYTPDSSIERGSQTYVGNSIVEAYPGIYELTITDQRLECPGISQTITIKANGNSAPFSVEGALQKVIESTTGSSTSYELVKVLGPNCESETDNGRIGIEISGGIKPFLIRWFKEEIVSVTDSVTLVEITSARNSTQLYDLSPGKYKLEITSEGASGCSGGASLNQNNYYEEYLIVPKNEQLYIIDGPFIDEDLCQGLPGRVYIEIFNNLQEGITFYYNGTPVSLAEEQPAKEGAYILLIDEPVDEASLLITNKEGCAVSSKIHISDIGIPEFEYFTPSLAESGIISAREEVTFTNTSALPYSYSEWNFGDGSEKETVIGNRTTSPTLHTYGISGTYYVTLRNYSDQGCYKEYSRKIVVGLGYNVIAPNAFTPNGDLINDRYRLLFSGFKKVSFKVFDQNGDLLHSETVEIPGDNVNTPIQLIGWDGQNETGSNFYAYHFRGILISDGSEIIKTGNFVIIK